MIDTDNYLSFDDNCKEDLLESLNEQQRQAVLINEGSLLVFAGAGSGKTRVITTKIAYSIKVLGIDPRRILAVTFTNKACHEMQDRVSAMIGEQGSKVVIRTFHSFGVWLLRMYGDRVGLDKNFRIYDDNDSAELLGRCFPEFDKRTATEYAKKISILKDKMQRPSSIDEKLCICYDRYQSQLKATGNVDFADMISKSIELLRTCKDVKEYVNNRFKVILVDEYQDSNAAQFALLSEIKGPDTFVCVVGDDDQSIYRFRGAEIRNILDFPNVFPNVKTVVLGRNYRCSQAILNVAKDVISKNVTRAKKTLEAQNSGGTKPVLRYVNSEFDEAAFVVDVLKRSSVSSYGKTAVLYRTNAQSKAFEDRFIVNNIPYKIIGALRFYDREEVKDCIAMIALLLNRRDSVSFARMINKPSRGIGETSVKKILEKAEAYDTDMFQACEKMLEEGELKGSAAGGVAGFIKNCSETMEIFEKSDNGSFLKAILENFGIMEYYRKRDSEEGSFNNKRESNINELVSMLSQVPFSNGYEGINTLMEYIALDPNSFTDNEESPENDNRVTLITMHNTKGLEYDRVFVTGLEQEIFPSRAQEATSADIEEERRIFYVALTRAKKELYITSASSRLMWGHKEFHTPSVFLDDIEKSHLDIRDDRYKVSAASRLSSIGGGYGYNDWNYQSFWKKSNAAPQQTQKQTPDRKYKSYLIKSGSTQAKEKETTTVEKKVVSANAGTHCNVTYKKDDRIRSEAYGEGTIVSVRSLAGREVIDVKFDNGKSGSFATSRVSFEKIKN